MKKFLSKTTSWLSSLLMVMLFAMGQSAWAQDAVFTFNSSGTYEGDNVTVVVGYYYSYGATHCANICNVGRDKGVNFTAAEGYKITKIELVDVKNWTPASASNFITCDIDGNSIGTYDYTNGIWEGSTDYVSFEGTSYNIDFGFTGAKIWLESTDPADPEQDYFAWKSLVKEDMKAVYDEYNGVNPTSSEVGKKPYDVVSAVMNYYYSYNFYFGPMGFGDDWESAQTHFEKNGSSVTNEYKKASKIWKAYTDASVVSSFGLDISKTNSWVKERIEVSQVFYFTEAIQSINGTTSEFVYLEDVMSFTKNGVAIECPVGYIRIWPNIGYPDQYLGFQNEVTEPGVYEFTFPAGLFVSEAGNINEAFTLTFTIPEKLNISNSAVDGDRNYWTTFSFNHPFSLPSDYTACIVTGADDGYLAVTELESTPASKVVEYDFSNNKVTYDGDNFVVDGAPEVLTAKMTHGSYSGDIQSGYLFGYSEYGDYVTISLPENAEGQINYVEVVPLPGQRVTWKFDNGAFGTTSHYDVNGKTVKITIGGAYYYYITNIRVSVEYLETPVIPAYTGILVKSSGAANDIKFVAKDSSASTADVTGNLLVAGNTKDYNWSDPNKTYYKFSLNGANEEGSAGFYWAEEGGHWVNPTANKAYLVLPNNSSVRGFRLDGKTDATEGIFNALNGEKEAGAVFNLNGQRVNGKPAAGVYVKNGRKFIVK